MEEIIEAINRVVVNAAACGAEDQDRSTPECAELMDSMYELLETIGYSKRDFNIDFIDEIPQFTEA